MVTSTTSQPVGQWILNTYTPTQTIPNTICISPQNQIFTTTTNNSTSINNTTFISLNDCSNIMTVNDGDVLAVLKGRGVRLVDGSFLKIKDDKPIIEHHHTEGCEKLRPVPISHYGTIDFSDSEHILGPGSILKLPDGTYLEIDSKGKMTVESFVNARAKPINVSGDAICLYECLAFCHFGDIHIPDGAKTNAVFTLPNGTTVTLFPDDHIEIDESNGRQLYRTQPVRGFNKFLNASDLLEQFIAYCATQKITRKDFAELPVSLFIYWLIVQAGEADGDSTVETVPLLTSAVKQQKYRPSQCKCCGKFIAKKLVDNGINFCTSEHMQLFLERI